MGTYFPNELDIQVEAQNEEFGGRTITPKAVELGLV